MVPRTLAPILLQRAAQYPVVTLTGPRQSGKTTLCRALFPHKRYVSLEDPDLRRFAVEDPRGFLESVRDGAILDEIQRAPELSSYLQGMVDADPRPGRFVLTGSQQFELMRHVSQSLAGRTAALRLLPFSLTELATLGPLRGLPATIRTGFLPRIHDRGLDPGVALGDYFITYVERDLRELAAVHDLQRFERFVRLCAGRVGQLLNFRDASGNEVDLLLPEGARFHAIEIKSGQTVQPDYFRGLKTFAAAFPDKIASGGVLFGGAVGQARSDWPVSSWRALSAA